MAVGGRTRRPREGTVLDGDTAQQTRTHIVQELGFGVRRAGDRLEGSASVVPEMFVPGTLHVRASILATWTDILAGLLAVDVMAPRVPVTLELDVHLYQPPPGDGEITGVGRVVKAGRTVFVGHVDFHDSEGRPIGYGAASFMVAPDPALRMPEKTSVDQMVPAGMRLSVPLAERAGCRRLEPGVAELSRSDDGLNSSRTVNGGLIALSIEEALLSAVPGVPGPTLSSLAMRYLQPVRIGPAVARAEVHGGLGRVEVRDHGNDERLAVTAVARLFGV